MTSAASTKTRANRTPTPSDDLPTQLRLLGLLRTAEDLDDIIARSTRTRWSPRQLLEEIAKNESADRARRSVERRMKMARIGRFKPMSDWDWNWPKSLERESLERVLSLEFIDQAENVIIIGAQGLGKTMIAKNLVHMAVLKGISALFTTASDLLLDLNAQDTARALERRIRYYMRPSLVCIDEIGYLSYDTHAADLLFQIISRRYEEKSIVLTSNLAFKQWNTVFPNASCAVALVDRLTHHARIITIQGDSYRRRHSDAASKLS